MKEPAKVADRLGSGARPVELCWRLLTRANWRDGSDNISVVVVRAEEQRPMGIDERLSNYLRTRGIDSFQKLHCLLFLFRHPEITGTTQEFGQQLYFGDTLHLREIMSDLQRAGLVDRVESSYRLRDDAEVRSGVQGLAKAFEDPLTRQVLLHQIKRGVGAPIQE